MTERTSTLSALLVLGLLAAFHGVVADVSASEPLEPVCFQEIKIGGFWKSHVKRLTEKWLPHCIQQMEKSGRGEELLNLVHTAKALKGKKHGEFAGRPWSDAYVYNTVESICLALAVDPDGDEDLAQAQAFLRRKLEEWIPIILAAQCDDGYIHSYHVVNSHNRYANINAHEFYVQGYFLEMGVAHYKVTEGEDRRLYDAAIKCADHLCATFGPPPKRVWIYGHPGMGYALCRLGRLVSEVEGEGRGAKYIDLAKFFFDTRHTVEEFRSPYRQSHRPVVEMEEAVGHAVRATYFYTAIADLAMLTRAPAYQKAVDRIWASAVHRKHYITGGVGASHRGEAFAEDFDLRNDGYCESCAACGMTFWAERMHRHHRGAHYIDVQERALYNVILGAVDLSGENFYYQNPLVSDRARYPWHGCPCCVGNIPRALIAIKDLMYSLDRTCDTLYVNHFVDSEGTIDDVGGEPLRIIQKTEYPWKGDVALTLHPERPIRLTLAIRIPDRTESRLYTATPEVGGKYTIRVNGVEQPLPMKGGFVSLRRTWQKGDTVELCLPMEIQRVRCDERVRANRGRVALTRGPVVYNVEGVDHECDVHDLILRPDAPLKAVWKPDLLGGVMAIEGQAVLEADGKRKPVKLLAVPNYVRLNRGGFSQVWITEDPEKTVAPEPPPKVVVRPIVRAASDKRTVDQVVIGNEQSEKRHGLRGKNTGAGLLGGVPWRHAHNGWFSYELQVLPGEPVTLVCTYWGSDAGRRAFDVMVEGRKIATQKLDVNRPGKYFEVEHEIPAELTQGKEKIRVKWQAHPGNFAGGLFGCAILRPKAEE